MPTKNRRWLIHNLLSSGLFGIALLLGFPIEAQSQGNCSCTNCPQQMPDNFQGNFYIQVQNATNPMLGQNGQGICGVTLSFDHEYLGDLEIMLTSPAGQTVTLVGPIGLFGETDGSSWNVTFVPCSEPASPDPGFAETWSNNQPWGLFGNYTGSYHPASGCLEDLNDGPVNGQWILTVTDVQNNDGGNFYDYAILFCDPTGIECVSCEARAGNLLQEDIEVCAGSDELLLNLPPSYSVPQNPPPAGTYSYLYIITQGGIIGAYDTVSDLRTYKPGKYSVCGLSYLTADSTDIPPPDGTLTVSQLSTKLNSSAPPFCGNITSNCVNVNILPPQPNVQDSATICAPECLEYHGKVFCESGEFAVLDTVNGCTYTATLHLTVLQPPSSTVYETVCAGTCAQTPGFEGFCESGEYMKTIPAAGNCDSLVILHLNVLQPEAKIDPPPALQCDQASLLLFGGNSSAGPGITYQWTASDGGDLIGTADQPNAKVGSAGTYALEVCQSGAGIICCDTAIVEVLADINPPAMPDSIHGSAQICVGQIQTWEVDSIPGATAYSWTIPQGVTILSGQGSETISLQWNKYAGDSICVQAENACGLSSSTCLFVSPIDSLLAPGIPVGPIKVCEGDTLLYVASGTAGPYDLQWHLPDNVTILAGQGTDSLLLVWGMDLKGKVCVQAINSCDSSEITCLQVDLVELLDLSDIQGADTVCAGSWHMYQTVVPEDAVEIKWQVAGGVISGPVDSSLIQVVWSVASSAGKVCLEAKNACGKKTSRCMEISIQALPDPNAGADTAICGLTHTLLANSANPANSGFWQLASGPGNAVFMNSASTISQVKVAEAGLYRFAWVEQNTSCAYSDTVAVQFNPLPVAQPGMFQCDVANESYTVPVHLTGGSPPYMSNGAAINGDLFVSAPFPNGSPYNFEFTDVAGCTTTVSGVFACACVTSAGQMDTVILKACADQTVTATVVGDVFLDGNDTRIFVLHSGSTAILGQVFDQNVSGEFGWVPGMQFDSIYYISMVVGNNLNGVPDINDPCFSVAPGQPVIYSNPPSPDAGIYLSNCGLSAPLSATPSSDNGQWSLDAGPGSVTFSSPNSAVSMVEVSQPGIYILKWTESSGVCSVFDTVSIAFLDIPKLNNIEKTCTGLNSTYIVQFDVGGGLPPYVINGLTGSINSTSFLSALLPSNSSYTFSITDANGCKSLEESISHSCQCTTNAGSMDLKPAYFCSGQPATGLYNNDAKFDIDDTIQFVLHDLPGTVLGNIISINDKPIFQYTPNLQTGQTYYISVIAGNRINGNVDLSDPCLAVAPGTPVTWAQLPEASLSGDTSICLGASVPLRFEASGSFPLTVSYTVMPGGQIYTTEILNTGAHIVNVSPDTTSTYTLVSVQDALPFSCIQHLNDAVTIAIQEPVSAGVQINTPSYCAGDTQTISLLGLLDGAGSGGTWMETSQLPSSGSSFDPDFGKFALSGQIQGEYQFLYTINGMFCPDDTAFVSVIVRAVPYADAGPDAELDCFTPNVALGGTGTTIGAGIHYTWHHTDTSQPLGQQLTFKTDTPGHYFLVVVDSFGCEAADSVLVIQENAPLKVSAVRVAPVRCFGEKNGRITIDSVNGGEPPVLFSLNDLPFSATRTFRNLGAGQYTLVAQDVTGCEWVDTFFIFEPPPIKIDLGPDVEAALGDSVYLWLHSSLPSSALDTLIWCPLLDSARAGTFQQHFQARHSGKVIAMAIDTNGCRAQDEILLQINRARRVYIPNVFKPGNFAENELRFSFGSDIQLVERMEVYGRWGELIYQARNCLPEDDLLGWDGTFNGQLTPPGTYVVRLTVRFVDGEQEEFAADVTIVR